MATNSESGEEPLSKKPSLDNDGVVNGGPALDGFQLKEILGNDIDRKAAFIHIQDNNKKDAVVILDKKPFCDDDFAALLDNGTRMEQLMRNDIYSAYEVQLPQKNSAIKATIIHPATSKHIEKYRRVDSVIVSETRLDYEQITLPYIIQNQFSTQWVENVLDGKAEQERIIYSDSDFLLAPDLKWDGKRLENLYVTAICRQRGIKSIRDLNESHLAMLRNIHKNGAAAVSTKYNVPDERLRIFVHYQPTYYHFHVHFVHVMHEAIGTAIGKAHLLIDIIENIEMVPDYYQKKTLYYTLKENDPLLAKFREYKQDA